MGFDLSIRFKGFVKKEFIDGFEGVALKGLWGRHPDKIIKSMARIQGHNYIPSQYGGITLYEWEVNDIPTDGFELSFDKNTGYWSFMTAVGGRCEYFDMLYKFIEIAPHFIDEIICLQTYYEGSECVDFGDRFGSDIKQYHLSDGKVIESAKISEFKLRGLDNYTCMGDCIRVFLNDGSTPIGKLSYDSMSDTYSVDSTKFKHSEVKYVELL